MSKIPLIKFHNYGNDNKKTDVTMDRFLDEKLFFLKPSMMYDR